MTQEDWRKFHHALVQFVCDYWKDKELDGNFMYFSLDHVKESVRFGNWCPYSDSSLTLYNDNKEILFANY